MCKRSCSMPAASLRKLDTTSQSWLVLPNTQGVTGYPCVCLLLAAQLPSWALAVCLVSLLQTCCFYRRHTCATSAFCASEAVHRKVCWLTCCVWEDRRLNTELRLALVSELAQVAGPTVTYGPYCTMRMSVCQICWLLLCLKGKIQMKSASGLQTRGWAKQQEAKTYIETPGTNQDLTAHLGQHRHPWGKPEKVGLIPLKP